MTTTVLSQIEEIINLVEADIPANPRSRSNERLAARLQKYLAEYFKNLQEAFPYDQLERLYTAHVKESVGTETGDILDPLLASFEDDLKFRLNGFTATAYLKGSAEMITFGQTMRGIPIAYEGPPIAQAVSYAEEHCAQLVTQMTSETKRRLAKVISDGIKDKRGIPRLARDIRSEFRDMRRYRSVMIARTETCDALEQAFMDRARQMNIEGKEWVTFDPCEICADNGAEGVVPIEHMFSSGHQRPPAHPNCRCALAPARLAGMVTTGPTEGTIADKVSEFGTRYRTAEIEHGAGFDSKANVLFTKTGSKRQIRFTPAEAKKLKNAEVFVHNHPSSTSFSPDDIGFAARIKAKKMVVTSEKYTYTMTPVGEAWDTANISRAYREASASIYWDAVNIFDEQGQNAADLWYYHNSWLKVQEEGLVNYVREAN